MTARVRHGYEPDAPPRADVETPPAFVGARL
ncbi:hypothetical protein FHU36_005521 [Nonomuraea muscovyensis]|uniref:Uncharacterized protein n=1 Tax=Nonomuraea muscovyensis TaxID=1124761 RepID=A0A7X0C7D0_9ACTN|nr:hypothetical protein [Nonomuraea muscovyensis]